MEHIQLLYCVCCTIFIGYIKCLSSLNLNGFWLADNQLKSFFFFNVSKDYVLLCCYGDSCGVNFLIIL